MVLLEMAATDPRDRWRRANVLVRWKLDDSLKSESPKRIDSA